jgi:hypothetical protein
MANPFNQVSGEAQRALEEFSTEFDMALAAADPDNLWSRMFGLVNSSRSIKTTYPLPVSSAGYVERKGDNKLRSLFTRAISMSPIEWQDGFAEKAMIVEAPDFIGWGEEPTRIAIEAARQPNVIVADMLETNADLGFYRDEKLGTDLNIALFAGNHPVNVFDDGFGTFDNDHTATAIDATMLKDAQTRFRRKKGTNGKPRGLKVTDMLVPPDRAEEAKDFLESDNLILAVQESATNPVTWTNNRHKGTVNLVIADELTDANLIYLLDSTPGVPKPWILQDGGSPEEIVFDKSDTMYKTESKIGMLFVLLMSTVGALPHAIERIDLS